MDGKAVGWPPQDSLRLSPGRTLTGALLEIVDFFAQARVFVVTGKGGVGKTTLSGVMANLAARHGLSGVVVELAAPGRSRPSETAHLSRLFGQSEALDYDELVLRAGGGAEVRARALRADTALVEYLHLHGMRRLSRKLASSGALDVVATAVPGMPDILVLGKVKQMERAAASGQPGSPDVIIVDAPAAGHAVRFLQSPRGLLGATGGGPVRAQAQEVMEMLSDPARLQVVLVTTPEETPVSETIETAQALEDRAGVTLCTVVVNGRLPRLDLPGDISAGALVRLAADAGTTLGDEQAAELVSAALLRRQRQQSQAAQVARLARELPLPQLELPFCFSAELGPDQLGILTEAMERALGGWVPVRV